MRIGIPRALLYYRYGRFWKRFLEELGGEVVLSRKTDEETLQTGLLYVPSEVCLPIKIVAGHLLQLKNDVEAVFFPRLNWLGDKLFACPKMIGIVDVARMLIGEKVKLIAPTINGNLFRAHFAAGLQINPNPLKVWSAWKKTKGELHRKPESVPRNFSGSNSKEMTYPSIALIGHFYNIGDEFISRAIVNTFKQNGYQIFSKEDLPDNILSRADGFSQNIRWVYERELFNAFEYFLGKVDGFCVVVSMGCGPDSLVAEFMRERAQDLGVPFLLLVIDEHTGEAGLVTRIEAFIELLRRRKKGRLN
ncbi:MAG: acyl-CoA dehydratase activase-related protein [candidate division WOR-3 bacterium]|jgi:predicted nucleotide-binding protein (sugar kinase/HSP70/actin superfamily)|nr:acyl-CoA dehydratase activase-related protein [candidate division WOR-3 bacterium]MDH7518632.1 acyl-CoA dehydratase activase-related protein [bacterium]